MKEFHQWISDMANSIEDKSTVTNKKKNSTELKPEVEQEKKYTPWYELLHNYSDDDEDNEDDE